jgi:hypothetical protein
MKKIDLYQQMEDLKNESELSEEAAGNYIHSDKFESPDGHGMTEVKEAFIEGAKWQAQFRQKVGHSVQVERSYSEEDLVTAFYSRNDNWIDFEEWFEQFKKK